MIIKLQINWKKTEECFLNFGTEKLFQNTTQTQNPKMKMCVNLTTKIFYIAKECIRSQNTNYLLGENT